ncbi:MAG TPA: DUF2203 domain-containing protein [Polyangiaceae bacterium]|nr:DUF2203 domain-containing protein [Polyangiaceae bacterium]
MFTIPEVNALIPTLNLIVAQQLREQSEIEQRLAELTQRIGRTPDTLELTSTDVPDVRRLKRELRERIRRYESGWQRVRALGGIVKDPQIGLVDFFGRVEGRPVWLCWRYGEDSLAYYHELDAGYRGRRPIRADIRRHLLN